LPSHGVVLARRCFHQFQPSPDKTARIRTAHVKLPITSIGSLTKVAPYSKNVATAKSPITFANIVNRLSIDGTLPCSPRAANKRRQRHPSGIAVLGLRTPSLVTSMLWGAPRGGPQTRLPHSA
jgi:hypothetical protein